MGFFASLLGFDEARVVKIKEEINILDAINAHILWKIRLEKYLNGTSEEKLDPKVICLDNQCKLGKWIHGTAQEHFQDDESLVYLRDEHAKFHVFASHIVSSVQANNPGAAQEIFDGDYKYTSRKVIFALTELSKHIQQMIAK